MCCLARLFSEGEADCFLGEEAGASCCLMAATDFMMKSRVVCWLISIACWFSSLAVREVS
jgi:hypothetical protein